MYSSYSFFTSALDGGLGRTLPPGKDPRYPLDRRVGGPLWTQRLEENSFCLCRESNSDGPVVQSVVSHYTDWATPAPINSLVIGKYSREKADVMWSQTPTSSTTSGVKKRVAICLHTFMTWCFSSGTGTPLALQEMRSYPCVHANRHKTSSGRVGELPPVR
jgi:hypothetical protein